MQTFDLAKVPLDGWNLLEANAGTGKTYSICGLYLRLILERSLRHDQIITITFTRAATGELRTRLIKTLLIAQQMLSPALPEGQDDAGVDKLLQQICHPWQGNVEALGRIEQALRSFDLAPVLTIHSFCQRVLTESSLTTGFNVDAQVLDHQNQVLGDLVQQAWFEHLNTLSAPLVRHLRKFDRQALSGEVIKLLARPFADIQAPELIDPGSQAEAIATARNKARQLWENQQTGIRELLQTAQAGMKQNSYKPEHIARSLGLMSRYLHSGVEKTQLPDIARLTQEKLVSGTRKGEQVPEHAFFEALQACFELEAVFVDACERYRRNLSQLLVADVNRLLSDWKRSSNSVTFDDLVYQLHEALDKPAVAQTLIKQVGQRYSALLVDEYQDTDPIQADIFRRLFEPLDCPVWRVGDPKQSLYGFRGADLHAYLAARDNTPNCYQLTQDWRAHPALVAVVNELFSATDRPFLLPQISFARAVPAPKVSMTLEIDGEVQPPLTVWSAGKGLNECTRSCASQIALLLTRSAEDRAWLVEGENRERLEAQDIAVLVRSNAQVQRMADALLALGIASSRPGVKSVFETPEAHELEQLLHAVAAPARRDRIAGALATRMLGMSAAEILHWGGDESSQDQWADRFRRWREIWAGQGVYPMLMAVLREAGVAERVLPLAEGESVMTNLLHLVDLMEVHTGVGYSVDEQLGWLNAQREAPASRDESNIVRLDRSTNVVRIATVHRAKGAQYPVVFCPYLWRTHNPSKNYVEVHEAGQLVLDFGTELQADRKAEETRERISENGRLAYVALTRAQANCYLPWSIDGASRTKESGLSHLLNPEHRDTYGIPPGKVNYPQLAAQYLDSFAAAGARVFEDPPSFGEPLVSDLQWPVHQHPKTRPLRRWQVTSYSSLFSGAGQDRDIDENVTVESVVADSSDNSIFSLPAGAQTGLMMHDLLENLQSFSADHPTLLSEANHHLARYSLDQRFAPAVARAMHSVLNESLGPDRVRLSQIPQSDQLREMEFHLNLPALRSADLWQVVRDEVPPGFFDAREVVGYLHGFIDLIVVWQGKYWVIDYKSTHLGASVIEYAAKRLAEDIHLHNYDFQYHLYLLALDQHLVRSLASYQFDTHFGGVLYLYVRGIDSSGCGVHYARPSAATLASMRNLLLK